MKKGFRERLMRSTAILLIQARQQGLRPYTGSYTVPWWTPEIWRKVIKRGAKK